MPLQHRVHIAYRTIAYLRRVRIQSYGVELLEAVTRVRRAMSDVGELGPTFLQATGPSDERLVGFKIVNLVKRDRSALDGSGWRNPASSSSALFDRPAGARRRLESKCSSGGGAGRQGNGA